MGKFIITDRGKALQAKVLAGKCKYRFTRMAIGDGFAADSSDYANKNDLISKKQDIEISDVGEKEGGICEVIGVVTNTGLIEAFYVREIGLFAEDPDEGEVLFAARYYERPSVMEAEIDDVYSKEFVFDIGVTSADSISVTVSPAGLLTRGALDGILARTVEGFFKRDNDGNVVLEDEPTVSTYFILDDDNNVVLKN